MSYKRSVYIKAKEILSQRKATAEREADIRRSAAVALCPEIAQIEREMASHGADVVKAVGMGANLLLNVGPGPDGKFPEEAAIRLKEIGGWLGKYGESVYGTTAGIIPPQDWGVTAMKDNLMYVHILSLNETTLFLPIKDLKAINATSLINGEKIKFKQDKNGITLFLDEIPSDINHVIKVEMK